MRLQPKRRPMADIESSNLKLVDLNEVLSRVKISQSTLYRMMSRGEFPRQLKLGSRSFWVGTEIHLFIKQMSVGAIVWPTCTRVPDTGLRKL